MPEGMAADAGGAIDTGLVSLATVAALLQLPANPDQLAHELGFGATVAGEREILRAGKLLELRCRAVSSRWERLGKIQLPAIAWLADGEPGKAANAADGAGGAQESGSSGELGGRWVVLAKLAEGKALIQDPRVGRPDALTREAFTAQWSGRLILATRRAMLAGQPRKFDVTWFIPALVRYSRMFRDVIAASFFPQIFALVTPLFFMVIVDKVLVHKGLTTLDVLIVGFLAIAVFEAALGGLRTYIFTHTANRIDVELGARLFRHVMALPMAYFQARRVGDTVARVRELDSIREFLTGSALTLAIDVFFTVVFFAVMYVFSPALTAIVLASLPFYIALSLIVMPILRKRLDEKFKRGAENQAFLVETVTGIETVKALAVEPQFRNRWDEQLAGYVSCGFKAAQLGNISSQAAQLISKVTTALTLYFGALLVIDGGLTVGQLVAFNMLAGRVAQPILKLVQLWQDFQQARISVDRLGDVLNQQAEPGHNPNRATPGAIRGAVVFEGVSFRYRPDGPEVLRQISLNVAPREAIGIVGPSGSGKSTLTKLIQRLYVPESGRVLVDGVDLALMEPAWLRRRIGVVLQENYLFNRSVRDNIALADPAAPMEKVTRAARLSGAHEFILELPEGYDTIVGERGGAGGAAEGSGAAPPAVPQGDPGRMLAMKEPQENSGKNAPESVIESQHGFVSLKPRPDGQN